MKKSMQRIIISVLGVILMLSMGSNAMAMTYAKSITILPNQIWSADYDNTDARTCNYSTVQARCHSVWPTSGSAVYHKIRCQVTNGYDIVISSVYKLDKDDANWTSIPLKEGYLSASIVGFEFSGNSNNDAYAIVSYDGK
ncbi:MAG: hypothetical protein K5796_09815 [Lachnospiraceae bacterium]|nr:hypothetical protein [Lachnospiraceae bacterium]